MVHFTLNPEERRGIFESEDVGLNGSGYDTLQDIINIKASYKGKEKNQIFVFGHFEDNDKVFNNFGENIDLNKILYISQIQG